MLDLDIGMAVVGGLVGTVAMTMAMYTGSMVMGLKMDMPMTLGTMLFPRGTAAWGIGLMMHLAMGVVFFIVYAALFSASGIHSAVAGWSALFGAVHGVLAGAAFGMMSMVHPRMATAGATSTGSVPAPGFFGLRLGTMAPMAIVLVHVVFGVVAGAIYAA